jgi:ABC-type sugar transport system ATPase subunit
MVYVTHDQVEAMTLADRIVVLNEGIVQQVGAPLELYRKPANQFVATFLGTPTMGIVDRHALGTSALSASRPPEAATAIGARPHDVRAVPATKGGANAGGGDVVRLGQVEVDLVERLGQESFAFGKLGGVRIGALVDEAHAGDVKPGALVALDVPRAKLTFFGGNGARIEA